MQNKTFKNVFAILALQASVGSASAQTVAFSFGSDTWDYASGPSTVGFSKQTASNSQTQSSGSITKSGLTVKFGVSFFGTATSGDNYSSLTSGSSLTFAPSGQNPAGFLLTSENNDSTDLPNGTSSALSGNISTYQRWHFEFSTPVTINSFLIQDIDNVNSNSFRDILGAEGFIAAGYTSAFSGNTLNSASLPAVGSGIDPNYGFNSPTELAIYNLSIGAQSLAVVSPNVNTGNPASSTKHSANVAFGDTQITAFSIYSLSNSPDNHRMSLDNGVFSITVPEPSATMLALVSAVGLLQRRRRA